MKKPLIFEAPKYHTPGEVSDFSNAVFLAGSITGASDWQAGVARLLTAAGILTFNPRRVKFDITDPTAEREQITWEHHYLSLCGIYIFYFAPETLAPITLLEYGATIELMKYAPWKKIYTAIHPDYKRRNDVLIQTELRNPELMRHIYPTLTDAVDTLIKDHGN